MCSLASALKLFLASLGEKPSAGSGSEEVDELVRLKKVVELKVEELIVVKVEKMSTSVLARSRMVSKVLRFVSMCAQKSSKRNERVLDF